MYFGLWILVGVVVAFSSRQYRRKKFPGQIASTPLPLFLAAAAFVVVFWPIEAGLFLKDTIDGRSF